MKSFSEASDAARRDLINFVRSHPNAIPVVAIVSILAGATTLFTAPLIGLALLSLPFIGLGLLFTGQFLTRLFESSEPTEDDRYSILYPNDTGDENNNQFSPPLQQQQHASGYGVAAACIAHGDDEGYVSPHDDETLGLLHAGALIQPAPETSSQLDHYLRENPGFASLIKRNPPATSRAAAKRFFTPITAHATAADDDGVITIDLNLNDFK